MNYETWAQDTKKKLSKLPDNELRTIANGNDVDGREIANRILLDRKNKSNRIGVTEEQIRDAGWR